MRRRRATTYLAFVAVADVLVVLAAVLSMVPLGAALVCLVVASGWVDRPLDLGTLRHALDLHGMSAAAATRAGLALYVLPAVALGAWAVGLVLHD